MALNPITKFELQRLPEDFSLSITNAIQQDVDALLNQSTTQPLSPTAADGSRKKRFPLLRATTSTTTTTNVKSLLQEWIELSLMHDEISAVCS